MTARRQWIVVLCVALLLLAFVAWPGFSLLLAPAPFWLVVALVVQVLVADRSLPPFPVRPTVELFRSPRPPPVR